MALARTNAAPVFTEKDLRSLKMLSRFRAVLADCGYADKATIERLGRERPELDLSISVHREDAHAERRYDWRPLDKIKAPKTLIDPVPFDFAQGRLSASSKARSGSGSLCCAG